MFLADSYVKKAKLETAPISITEESKPISLNEL
jgi:hypothetical protein